MVGGYLDLPKVTGDERELAAFVARTVYDQASGSIGAFARLMEFFSGAPRPILYQTDLDLAVTFHGSREQPNAVLLEDAFSLADRLADQKRARAVVVLDEFQELREMSSKVRAILREHMANTAYVFMGSEVGMLAALVRDPKMMPFRLATPIDPGLPSPDAWRDYITRRFAGNHVALRSGEADELIAFTGGHPRDLREACEHLLTIRSLNPDANGAVALAQAKAVKRLEVRFDEVWHRLEQPAGTQTTAVRIASGQAVYGRGRPRKSVTRSIDGLQKEGLIRRAGRGVDGFTEPLFGHYVRDTAGAA